MDFAQQQRKPTKHTVGFICVVVLHIIVIWGLLNGLGKRVVDLVRPPETVKIVQDVKPPPPPPQVLPPPPKMLAPPPPYIPPVEVQIQTPPPVAVITTQNTPPPTTTLAPAQTVAPATAGPPAPKTVTAACANARQVAADIGYPPKAQRADIASGTVVVRFTVGTEGEVKNLQLVSTTNRLFNDTAMAAARQLKCAPEPVDTVVEWSLGFKLE